MPGVESFSSNSTVRSRGTVSFAEPGGPIQLYSESPLGQQQAIYNRILETQGPTKANTASSLEAASNAELFEALTVRTRPVVPPQTLNLSPPPPQAPKPVFQQQYADLYESLTTRSRPVDPLPPLEPISNAQIAETAAKASATVAATATVAEGVGATEVAGTVLLATNPEILVPIGIGLLALGTAATIYSHLQDAPDKLDLGVNLAPTPGEGQETGATYVAQLQTSLATAAGEGKYYVGDLTGPVEVTALIQKRDEFGQPSWYFTWTDANGYGERCLASGNRGADFPAPGQWSFVKLNKTGDGPTPAPVLKFPSPSAYPQPALAPDKGLAPGASPLPYAEPPAKSLPLGLDLAPSQSQKQPEKVELPKGVPVTISSAGATPVTVTTSSTEPSTLKLPGKTSGATTPLSISTPSGKPVTFSTPGTGPVTISIPGYNPITVDPTGQTKTGGLTRSSNPTTTSFTPTSTRSTDSGTGKTDDKKDDTKAPAIDPAVLTGLAAITTILQGLQKNVTPEAIQSAAAAGTCQTLQPGSCLEPTADNAKSAAENSKANGTKLDRLNTLLQGADLGLLKVMDNKLGPQVTGGISGFLAKFAKSIHLDKAINALTLITSLHNAAMLSRNLGQTLGDVTSQALTLIGIKDENDSPIDVNEIIGKQVNSFFENILGADTWRGIKTSWNKANAIISSATQILSSVRSLWDSGKEILEWTAENTGKIGNALKRFRVVGENAYGHMPEQVTAQNAWSLRINRFREGTDSLDDAASSLEGVLGEVQGIQEEYKDLKEQKERFDKNIADLTPKSRPDNKPVADAVAAGKAASKAPSDAANVYRGEGESNA